MSCAAGVGQQDGAAAAQLSADVIVNFGGVAEGSVAWLRAAHGALAESSALIS
eukprot:COSAG01_NODE_2874_length_6937_cov_4.473823_6_plen_53_part_00